MDIIEVIGPRVALTPAGREFKGCCPFHEEASPSFWVSPHTQLYHCFGCGAHGSATDFLLRYEGRAPVTTKDGGWVSFEAYDAALNRIASLEEELIRRVEENDDLRRLLEGKRGE